MKTIPAVISLALLVSASAGFAQPSTAAQKPGAPPPVGAEPQSTTANFGDWMLRCVRSGDGDAAQKLCEVVQSIEIEGQKGPFAQIAIGRVSAKDPLRVTLVLPNNITLSTGPKLSVKDKDGSSVALNYRRCLPGGCFADGDPSDQLSQWRAATTAGQIDFADGIGRTIGVPFSYRGLAQALDALTKG